MKRNDVILELSDKLESKTLKDLKAIVAAPKRPCIQRIAAMRLIEQRWMFDSPHDAWDAYFWVGGVLKKAPAADKLLRAMIRDFGFGAQDNARDMEYTQRPYRTAL